MIEKVLRKMIGELAVVTYTPIRNCCSRLCAHFLPVSKEFSVSGIYFDIDDIEKIVVENSRINIHLKD